MAELPAISLTSPGGTPLLFEDLGPELSRELAGEADASGPVKISLTKMTSKAGNPYYQWDMNRFPLPDGFATKIVIAGVAIPFGPPATSKKGNQMCSGRADVQIGRDHYVASTLVVRTRTPYWLKVVLRIKPGRRKNVAKAATG